MTFELSPRQQYACCWWLKNGTALVVILSVVVCPLDDDRIVARRRLMSWVDNIVVEYFEGDHVYFMIVFKMQINATVSFRKVA